MLFMYPIGGLPTGAGTAVIFSWNVNSIPVI